MKNSSGKSQKVQTGNQHKPASTRPRQQTDPSPGEAYATPAQQQMLQLQRTVGNRAARRTLSPPAAPSHRAKVVQAWSGPPVVQTMLNGTHAALSAVSTHGRGWNKILTQLNQYEQLEATQIGLKATVNQAKNDPMANAMAKFNATQQYNAGLSQMTAKLTTLINLVQQWMNVKKHRKAVDKGKELTVKRMHALKMLLPRLTLEKHDLQSGKFGETSASGNLNVVAERAVGGAMNQLDRVTLNDEEGFFQEEKVSEDAELAGVVGLAKQDPALGARSVAMYRLNEILELDVLAKTEFAVSNRTNLESGNVEPTMGIYMETAKGDAAADVFQAGDLDFTDPVLQQSMVKLQLLDVICGQVDRHMGNYFIQRDNSGQVVGVQGIDNDMSFGLGMNIFNIHGTRRGQKGATVGQYRGIPPLIDSEAGNKIINTPNNIVEEALSALLSPEEVQHTMARFQALKQTLRAMQAQNLFIDQWGGQQTADTLGRGKDTYFGALRDSVEHSALLNEGLQSGLGDLMRPTADMRYRNQQQQIQTLEGSDNEDNAMMLAELKRHEKDQAGWLREVVGGVIGPLATTVEKGELTQNQAFQIVQEMGTTASEQEAGQLMRRRIQEIKDDT